MKNKKLTDDLLELIEGYKGYVKSDPTHFMTCDVQVGIGLHISEYDEKKEQQIESKSFGENFSHIDYDFKRVEKFRNAMIDILEENGLEYLGHIDN